MNKLIKLLLLTLISFNSFGQSIEEIEKDLSSFTGKITYIPKIDKARGLLKRDPFNYIAIRYILDYYQETQTDSISLFLDNLIESHPNNVTPIILRLEFLHYEYDFEERSTYNKLKVFYLDSAYQIDENNSKVLYLLSEVYYKDFIYPFEKEQNFGFNFEEDEEIDSTLFQQETEIKKSVFQHSADSALVYFYKLWQNDTEIRDIIYYPIRQLECHLQRTSKSQIQINAEFDFKQCYFPSWYFANLDENWQCDNTVDYLFAIESSERSANWLQIQLEDLKEPCLYDEVLQVDSEIIRFTWLRSFDHPISIRIEKENDNIVLIWKEGKGAGGYNPQGLKKKGKKKINSKKWNNISKLMENVKLDSLQNEHYILMNDGASWILERKWKNGYKAHKTNWPNHEFKEFCLYLLELTNLRVKESDIY